MQKAVAIAVVLSFVSFPSARGQEASSAKSWARCTRCHQPPDLSFATDRAWLDQIKRTA